MIVPVTWCKSTGHGDTSASILMLNTCDRKSFSLLLYYFLSGCIFRSYKIKSLHSPYVSCTNVSDQNLSIIRRLNFTDYPWEYKLSFKKNIHVYLGLAFIDFSPLVFFTSLSPRDQLWGVSTIATLNFKKKYWKNELNTLRTSLLRITTSPTDIEVSKGWPPSVTTHETLAPHWLSR